MALLFHSGHRIFFLMAIHIIILLNNFPIKIHCTEGTPHAFRTLRDTNPEQGRNSAVTMSHPQEGCNEQCLRVGYFVSHIARLDLT